MIRGYRIVFALLVIFAIGYQLHHLYEIQERVRLGNFFSYFTIQSNIFASAVFLVAALTSYGERSPRRFDLIRGSAVLYMVTTGIVYELILLGHRDEVNVSVIWVDDVLHRVFPLVVAADWLIAPPARRITFRQGLIWLSYPAFYAAYTLIRGSLVDWYPYPFLDPHRDSGYAGVTLYAIGIATGMIGFIWMATWLTRVRVKESALPTIEQRSTKREM